MHLYFTSSAEGLLLSDDADRDAYVVLQTTSTASMCSATVLPSLGAMRLQWSRAKAQYVMPFITAE